MFVLGPGLLTLQQGLVTSNYKHAFTVTTLGMGDLYLATDSKYSDWSDHFKTWPNGSVFRISLFLICKIGISSSHALQEIYKQFSQKFQPILFCQSCCATINYSPPKSRRNGVTFQYIFSNLQFFAFSVLWKFLRLVHLTKNRLEFDWKFFTATNLFFNLTEIYDTDKH